MVPFKSLRPERPRGSETGVPAAPGQYGLEVLLGHSSYHGTVKPEW